MGPRGKNYDLQFKIVLVGDENVGKSSILRRYIDVDFNETSPLNASIGVDFKHKIIKREGKSVKMQIWDTAGSERYNTITTAYYRGADAAIVVCDAGNATSLQHATNWIQDVNQFANEGYICALLCNKSDLEHDAKKECKNMLKVHSHRSYLHFASSDSFKAIPWW